MNPIFIKLGLFIGCAIISILLNGSVYSNYEKYAMEKLNHQSEMPAIVTRSIAGEFDGVMADFYQFKLMSFMGMRLQFQTPPTYDEWYLMYNICLQTTHLDPRFWDPYQFAEMMLAWQAKMFKETNELLLIAAEARPNDFRPHYFLGFNYFYFLKDTARASHHMRLAAKQPEAPVYLKGLASRLSIYGNQTRLGIAFLKDLLATSSDPLITAYFQKRIDVLEILVFLEDKVKEFKNIFHVAPNNLSDLVENNIIKKIPTDPYGGEFTLLPNGRVYTTSKLVEQQLQMNP